MKQKSLLEFLEDSGRNICKYCGKEFRTEKGLKMHYTKVHFFHYDEDVKVLEVDEDHVQLNIKMRKTLFQDLMKTVKRSGVDLCNFLSEAFIFGDFLFDHEVKKYIAHKAWTRISREIEKCMVHDGKEDKGQLQYIV